MCNEFGNDAMKMCFEHKTRMKVDHIINDIYKKNQVVIYCGTFVAMIFLMFKHALFFSSFIVVCTLKCYKTSDVHLTILYETK
jgi:hypothetical protein